MFIIDKENIKYKLQNYLLNKEHPVGKSKAIWFERALSFTQDNIEELLSQIVFDTNQIDNPQYTKYGTKYEQVIPLLGTNGRKIDVTFVWIEKDGVVRIVTAVPTQKEK